MTPRGLRVVALSVVLGGTALLLSGCSWSEALGLGWPEGITPEAHVNRELWIGSLIAALVIGVIVWGLFFWTAAFHRHKKADTELPRQFGYNMPLELVLTVTPFLIISVLFYFTVVVQERMLHKDPNPEVVVDVTAFQWNWKFGYQKIDFTDGTFTYDGADNERKAAMESRPEGVDSHGEELVGASTHRAHGHTIAKGTHIERRDGRAVRQAGGLLARFWRVDAPLRRGAREPGRERRRRRGPATRSRAPRSRSSFEGEDRVGVAFFGDGATEHTARFTSRSTWLALAAARALRASRTMAGPSRRRPRNSYRWHPTSSAQRAPPYGMRVDRGRRPGRRGGLRGHP